MPGKDTCLVKQLSPIRSDPQFLNVARRLFKTEASTLHNLGNHRQIPKLLAYFEEEEKFYLVQQYIKGATLTSELDGGQKWSESEVIALLRDGLGILQFVHEKRVIHRDIKPDNIIRRDSDHKIVLVDFGSVKEVLQEQKTHIGQLTVAVGTQGYMPTEQARGKPRITSDIYALGMIGIQALTGIVPIDLPEDDEGEIIWESSANASSELLTILTRMTRYHFKDRYQTAADVLQALDRLSVVDAKIKKISTDKKQSSLADRLSSHSQEISQQPKSSSINIHGISEITANSPSLTSAAVQNDIEQSNFTVINPKSQRESQSQSPKSKIGSLAIAFVLLSVIGSAVYLMRQYYPSRLQINSPSQQKPENKPSPSQERLEQGEGFRKDL